MRDIMTPEQYAEMIFREMQELIQDFNGSTYEKDTFWAKQCALLTVNKILLTYYKKHRKNIKNYLYIKGKGWGWWNTMIWRLYRIRRTDIRYYQEVKLAIEKI